MGVIEPATAAQTLPDQAFFDSLNAEVNDKGFLHVRTEILAPGERGVKPLDHVRIMDCGEGIGELLNYEVNLFGTGRNDIGNRENPFLFFRR